MGARTQPDEVHVAEIGGLGAGPGVREPRAWLLNGQFQDQGSWAPQVSGLDDTGVQWASLTCFCQPKEATSDTLKAHRKELGLGAPLA